MDARPLRSPLASRPMAERALTVCVYCASSEQIDAEYRKVAADVGRAIADEGWRLVYGGGNVGLMGEVARAALDAGGHVTGVIPDRLADREVALESVTELIRTDTMRQRKALMDERSDAFLVLPGGIGTLEELLEILTLKQLGYHNRAVVILDDAGFWDPLLRQFHDMVERRFAQSDVLELFDVATDVASAMQALRAYRPPPARLLVPTEAEEVESIEDPRD